MKNGKDVDRQKPEDPSNMLKNIEHVIDIFKTKHQVGILY